MSTRRAPGTTVAETRHWRKQCKAKAKATGKQCSLWALEGQEVCHKHGGGAPQNRRAGAKRMALFEVEVAAENYVKNVAFKSTTGLSDPLTALSELAAEILAMKDALAQRVNHLQGELSSESVEGVEQARAVVQLYERTLDRAVRVTEIMARLDVDGKKVRIQEQQAELVAGLLLAVLAKADLADAQAEQIKAGMLAGLERISQEQRKAVGA